MLTIDTIRNGLADAIRHAAKGIAYDVRDVAPNTDRDMVAHYRLTGRVVIWSGASDRTIFGDARTNWLFRAWHDLCHIRSGVCNAEHGPLGCFEPIAEFDVADYQCRGLSDSLAKLVQCEVSG